MSDGLITAQNILNEAVPEVREQLSQFISSDNFDEQITLAFDQHSDEIVVPLAGTEISDLPTFQSSDDAKNIINQWLGQENIFPEIEIVSSAAIDGAQGAYAAKTNQIYLSQEFLIENQHNPDAVESVLLEELGHSFSTQINSEDAPGDEGAIFSRLVRQEASPSGERIPPETLAALKAEDDTATVNLNGETIQIEQAREGVNPAFDLIGLTDLRNDPDFKNIDGTGSDVVVIDSGLDYTHPQLDDNYELGYDFVNQDRNPNDLNNHGTHVAGIIGAESENIGVAPDVGLIGLKVANANGELDNQVVNDALREVLLEVTDPDTETNIVAVNLSLGAGFYTNPNQADSAINLEGRRLIEDLESEGVVVVAAAGNHYENKPPDGDGITVPNQEQNLSAPAIYSTLAVGAVWQNNLDPDNFSVSEVPGKDRITAFSQRLDSDNFLFAPGTAIESTIPETVDGELFDEKYGTSQASPHVAGSVALLQEIAAEYNVRLTPEQVKDYLIDNADLVTDGDNEIDLVDNTNLDYPRINIHQSAIALKKDLEDFVDSDVASIELNSLTQETITNSDREISDDNLILESLSEDDTGQILGASDLSDIELYRFVATEDRTIKIQVDTSQEYNTAPGLSLFDASGQEIVSNDGENSLTQGSLLEVAVEADTEYYIEVNGIGINDSSTTAKDYDPLTGQVSTPESQENYTLTIDPLPQSFQTTDSTADHLSNNSDSSLPIYPITQSELEVSSETDSTTEQDELIASASEANFGEVGVSE